jgi:hypothetical protein
MKVGRNDPCPCGSGKKYKKCCLAKDQEAQAKQSPIVGEIAPPFARPSSLPFPLADQTEPSRSAPVVPVPHPTPPSRQRTPAEQRLDARWKEFESQDGEGRIGVFFKTLDDQELMVDDMAFEMLSRRLTRHKDCPKLVPSFAEVGQEFE